MVDLHSGIEIAREQAVVASGMLQRVRDPELASIVAFAAAHYSACFGGLSIITGRRQILLATVGTHVVETPREASICQCTIQRPGEPLIVQDLQLDERFSALPRVPGLPPLRFYAGMSVTDKNGFALGALCVGDRQPRMCDFDPTALMIHAREVERLLRW